MCTDMGKLKDCDNRPSDDDINQPDIDEDEDDEEDQDDEEYNYKQASVACLLKPHEQYTMNKVKKM